MGTGVGRCRRTATCIAASAPSSINGANWLPMDGNLCQWMPMVGNDCRWHGPGAGAGDLRALVFRGVPRQWQATAPDCRHQQPMVAVGGRWPPPLADSRRPLLSVVNGCHGSPQAVSAFDHQGHGSRSWNTGTTIAQDRIAQNGKEYMQLKGMAWNATEWDGMGRDRTEWDGIG